MPRTKAVRKVKKEESNDNPTLLDLLIQLEDEALSELRTEWSDTLVEIEQFTLGKMTENQKTLDKTAAEMSAIYSRTLNSTNQINSVLKTKRKRTRSVSNDDDGYLTASSSRSRSSTNRSRSTTRNDSIQKKPRKSQSVPRQAGNNSSMKTNKKENYKTPLNKRIPSFNVITPKMKPNTPQVLLRRPKQGEVAVSLQGSPLMVSNVSAETEATVNIPVNNGILALQPNMGLRLSQVPQLDPETQRQLEVLRDNLSKLCSRNTHQNYSKK